MGSCLSAQAREEAPTFPPAVPRTQRPASSSTQDAETDASRAREAEAKQQAAAQPPEGGLSSWNSLQPSQLLAVQQTLLKVRPPVEGGHRVVPNTRAGRHAGGRRSIQRVAADAFLAEAIAKAAAGGGPFSEVEDLLLARLRAAGVRDVKSASLDF